MVLNSALFDVRGLWDNYPPVREQLVYNLTGDSGAQISGDEYREFTLEGYAPQADLGSRPSLILHASDDIYIHPSQAHRTAEWLGHACQLVVWPDGGHNMAKVGVRALPPAWDWLCGYLRTGILQPYQGLGCS
jgi:pimeloyl-ACP methyl ester carboxylesterase